MKQKQRQIYMIKNNINNKIYIGKDSSCIKKYYGSGIAIKKAIKKYGIENFTKTILEEGFWTLNTLNEKEIYWIEKYKSYEYKIGYNRSKGGDGFNDFNTININIQNKRNEKLKKIRKSKKFRETSRINTINYYKDINNKKEQSNRIKKYWNSLDKLEKNKKIEKLKKSLNDYKNSEKYNVDLIKKSNNWKINNPSFNDQTKEKIKQTKYKRIQKNCKKIEIDGIIYEKLQYAIDQLNITRNCLVKRLKSKKFPNYKRL